MRRRSNHLTAASRRCAQMRSYVCSSHSRSLHAGERGACSAGAEMSGLPEEERVGSAKILLKSEGASAAGEGRCLAASEGCYDAWSRCGDDGPTCR